MAGVTAVIIAFIGITSLDDGPVDEPPFHITLADPDLYANGEFTEAVWLDRGQYKLRFTPNGDSPRILSIIITGDSFSYGRDFELEGMPHNTGISEYYTWEYLGEKQITVPESQMVQITISPNGNILGPVSVSLLEQGGA